MDYRYILLIFFILMIITIISLTVIYSSETNPPLLFEEVQNEVVTEGSQKYVIWKSYGYGVMYKVHVSDKLTSKPLYVLIDVSDCKAALPPGIHDISHCEIVVYAYNAKAYPRQFFHEDVECENRELTWYKMSSVNKKVNDPSPQLIPRTIYQTNNEYILGNMKDAIDTWIHTNPEYDYVYFTSHECRQFIEENFDDIVLKAYDTLIPGAFKADLWRYCVLYIRGGVYVDSMMVCKRPLKEMISARDTFVSAIDDGVTGGIYNAFICCTPKHDIMKRAIDIVVHRVINREYGNRDLYPTGPLALGDAINDYLSRPRGTNFSTSIKDVKLYIRMSSETNIGVVRDLPTEGDKIYILTKYKCFAYDKRLWSNSPSYNVLWKHKKIYTS